MFRIATVRRGTDKIVGVAPATFKTEIQAKAEILFRNERSRLSPDLERVVLAPALDTVRTIGG